MSVLQLLIKSPTWVWW